jgi:hypothetical protein
VNQEERVFTVHRRTTQYRNYTIIAKDEKEAAKKGEEKTMFYAAKDFQTRENYPVAVGTLCCHKGHKTRELAQRHGIKCFGKFPGWQVISDEDGIITIMPER